MTKSAFDRLRDRLVEVTGRTPRRSGVQVYFHCPSHEDRLSSLSLRPVQDRVLVHCHGGCHVDEVLHALGMTKRDLFDGDRWEDPWTPPRPKAPPPDPSWTYVTEPLTDRTGYRKTFYAASTIETPVGNHPGGAVPPWRVA